MNFKSLLSIALLSIFAMTSCYESAQTSYEPSTYDHNGDGRIDETLYFDNEGNTSKIEADENFDGKTDIVYYLESFAYISSKEDVDYNGVYDIFHTYEHSVLKRTEIRPNNQDTPILTRVYHTDHYIELIDSDNDGAFDLERKFDRFERLLEEKKFKK